MRIRFVNLTQSRIVIEGFSRQHWPVGMPLGIVLIMLIDVTYYRTVGGTISWAEGPELYKVENAS